LSSERPSSLAGARASWSITASSVASGRPKACQVVRVQQLRRGLRTVQLPVEQAYRAVGQAAIALEPAIRLLFRLPGSGPVLRELIRRLGFSSQVSASVLDMVVEMISATPIKVLADVLPCFRSHDKLVALDALRRVSTLVLVGARDTITPPRYSRRIAAAVPGADLVVVPNTGHILMLERPGLVSEWLRAMVTSVWAESAERESA